MHLADTDPKQLRLHSRYIFCVHVIPETQTHDLDSASGILGLKTRTPLVRWENTDLQMLSCMLVVIRLHLKTCQCFLH